MGHSRPETTLKVYQHFTGKQEKDVLKKLTRAEKNKTGPQK
jgi:hypothetical protein